MLDTFTGLTLWTTSTGIRAMLGGYHNLLFRRRCPMWIVQQQSDGLWRDVCRFDDETDAELYAMHMVDTYRVVYYKTGHQMDIEEYLS
jgi:hypothetical protein